MVPEFDDDDELLSPARRRWRSPSPPSLDDEAVRDAVDGLLLLSLGSPVFNNPNLLPIVSEKEEEEEQEEQEEQEQEEELYLKTWDWKGTRSAISRHCKARPPSPETKVMTKMYKEHDGLICRQPTIQKTLQKVQTLIHKRSGFNSMLQKEAVVVELDPVVEVSESEDEQVADAELSDDDEEQVSNGLEADHHQHNSEGLIPVSRHTNTGNDREPGLDVERSAKGFDLNEELPDSNGIDSRSQAYGEADEHGPKDMVMDCTNGNEPTLLITRTEEAGGDRHQELLGNGINGSSSSNQAEADHYYYGRILPSYGRDHKMHSNKVSG